MITLAIIDTVGVEYNHETLNKRGLGGSESSVLYLSKELEKVGFDVTVFNNWQKTCGGTYNNITYKDCSDLDTFNDYHFDVVISMRSLLPFLPPELWEEHANYFPQRYAKIKENAKLKAVWMQDTHCAIGDAYFEDMVVQKHVDEIFTLADMHTTYVTTCNHNKPRMFEVIKDKIFQTRNGITRHITDIDVSKKEPLLFIHNSSLYKGMIPLVLDIWPLIKERIPQARLKIIGGYYFLNDDDSTETEFIKKFKMLANHPNNALLDIEFVGIIPQNQVAELCSRASFMIYPCAYHEMFGISTLESLAYNTPLLTTRYGALEETAVNKACYMIDYPIEPNSLFPHINKEQQVIKFVNMVINAVNDTYLYQQKVHYCNIVKDISSWDTIALQWKQHIYKKLGYYLPVDEYRKVCKINHRVREVFGRRFTNPEENYIPRTTEQRILIITPMYNAEKYIENCIKSVITQDYDNYHMYVIDDASTDQSYAIAKQYENENDKITVIKNEINVGAVCNQITTIRKYGNSTDIIMLLDGDDSLVNNNQIFHFYNNTYDGTTEFTYGSCWSVCDSIPLVAQHYPERVKQTKSYRNHRFFWRIPFTHLRTFAAKLLHNVSDSEFKDQNNNWYRAGGDTAVFYSLIEQADPDKVKSISDIVYNYNDANPLNDFKVNSKEQNETSEEIINTNDITTDLERKIRELFS